MPNFHEYMMRHGEYGVQDLIERMERYRGLRVDGTVPLEQRWVFLMQDNQDVTTPAVAA